MRIEDYFSKNSMSVHLKEDNYPFAKKGTPETWQFQKIGNKKLAREDLVKLSESILEGEDALVEIDRQGSTVVQKGQHRIAITRPPFSDAWEITAVRPVRLMELSEYGLSEELQLRIETAEGILVAGPPGQGKTTFARALALHYAAKNCIVKTIESPRDMILPPTITQLSISHAQPDEIRDILLLSRPDYTIFDEMRSTRDFRLFTDLRLSGVGMVGIVHATKPIDAVQRFIGRIELGVIPQIIDTILFVEKGKVTKVFSVDITVKTPLGMQDSDLARPVVVIKEGGELVFEVYSYGEQTIVVPASKVEQDILGNLKNLLGSKVRIEQEGDKFIVVGRTEEIALLEEKYGKGLRNLKDLAVIEPRPIKKTEIEFELQASSRHIIILPKSDETNNLLDIYIDGKFLMSSKASKKNQIRVSADSDIGNRLFLAVKSGSKIVLCK